MAEEHRMMTVSTRIVQQGIHRWPDAPDRRGYLRYPHRHLFGVTVVVAVEREGRQVEFHDLGDATMIALARLGTAYHPDSLVVDYGDQSCETMALRLRNLLAAEYAVISVTVSEDWENDATTT